MVARLVQTTEMNLELVEKIANAVLYEGYMLYPYRASSVKNRHRFNWGALAPRAYSEAQNGTEVWEMQTEVLVLGGEKSELNIKLRFLHLTDREIGKVEPPSDEVPTTFELFPSLEVNGRILQPWQEAVERDVQLPIIKLIDFDSKDFDFSFPASRNTEPIVDENGKVAGVIVRTQSAIHGNVQIQNVRDQKRELSKISVRIRNTTPIENADQITRDDALLTSIVSTHTILSVTGGEFVSLLEPPDEFAEVAVSCENIKTFPVLAGDPGSRDCMLSSPIILYDYPEIAPESPGDLYDSAEIDEILTLRIMTLTDEEKREMRDTDERARRILERTELMPEEQLLKMHGAVRGLRKAVSS